MSPYEQYISHIRTWLSKYHLSFEEIEKMPLDVLFNLEVVDSKIEAAGREEIQRSMKKPNQRKKSIEYYI